MSMEAQSYSAVSWKCPLYSCHDFEPHLHAETELLQIIADLKKERPSEAFKAGVQKIIDDAKVEQKKLFQKNSSLAVEVDRLRAEVSRLKALVKTLSETSSPKDDEEMTA